MTTTSASIPSTGAPPATSSTSSTSSTNQMPHHDHQFCARSPRRGAPIHNQRDGPTRIQAAIQQQTVGPTAGPSAGPSVSAGSPAIPPVTATIISTGTISTVLSHVPLVPLVPTSTLRTHMSLPTIPSIILLLRPQPHTAIPIPKNWLKNRKEGNWLPDSVGVPPNDKGEKPKNGSPTYYNGLSASTHTARPHTPPSVLVIDRYAPSGSLRALLITMYVSPIGVLSLITCFTSHYTPQP